MRKRNATGSEGTVSEVRVADPQIAYAPCLGATSKAELEALASVYAFLIERYVRQKTAENGDE